MNFKNSNQLSIYYETHGDPSSPPVVLLHGIGADHNMWKPQIKSFPEAEFFVIVPDLRGHGVSDVPETFTIPDCARDIKELLDVLEIQHAHLVGVSMGGMVTQQFVAQYPERVITQVIVDSLSGVTRPIERFNANLAAFLLKMFPAKFQAWLIRSSYKKMEHDDVGQYFEDRILGMDSRWLLMARQEVNHFNILEKLPEMKTPTLVLVGDAFGNLAMDMARTTAENIPGAKFQILESGGDPSNLLVPEAFDKIVIDFLRDNSRSSKPGAT